MANKKLCLNRSPIKLRLESAQTQTSELFKIKSDLYSFLRFVGLLSVSYAHVWFANY